ncbi:hypothetical protein [uncultured Microscilla sp.]|uniref:hypothetical protein n=1 Tax=uncultured Microscilla sp. TaxID=432653 RepID=UPI002632D006|nr:hypothetical protein [uncultured Microscilla sp.]
MKKLALALLYLIFLTGCGKSSEESGSAAKDSIEKMGTNTKKVKNEQMDAGMVKNRIFAFGVNLKDCDALTYSEYWAMMKFNNDNTVEAITAEAMNTGGTDFFELRTTSKGTYKVEHNILTIQFTSVTEEKIKQGKTVESKEKKQEINWSFKMTKCEDGRLQLKSNMEGKNALGVKAEPGDNSSWALKM